MKEEPVASEIVVEIAARRLREIARELSRIADYLVDDDDVLTCLDDEEEG